MIPPPARCCGCVKLRRRGVGVVGIDQRAVVGGKQPYIEGFAVGGQTGRCDGKSSDLARSVEVGGPRGGSNPEVIAGGPLWAAVQLNGTVGPVSAVLGAGEVMAARVAAV